ncbi:hypothetical protein EC918_101257 [Burkholderia vietnamiensis]|jgi:hypothetical protein|nr:hypothetical protein EC918_101257 [Burkholderia vietnamiensis]
MRRFYIRADIRDPAASVAAALRQLVRDISKR